MHKVSSAYSERSSCRLSSILLKGGNTITLLRLTPSSSNFLPPDYSNKGPIYTFPKTTKIVDTLVIPSTLLPPSLAPRWAVTRIGGSALLTRSLPALFFLPLLRSQLQEFLLIIDSFLFFTGSSFWRIC